MVFLLSCWAIIIFCCACPYFRITSCFHSHHIIHTNQTSLDKPSVSFGERKTSCSSNQNFTQGLNGVYFGVLSEMSVFVIALKSWNPLNETKFGPWDCDGIKGALTIQNMRDWACFQAQKSSCNNNVLIVIALVVIRQSSTVKNLDAPDQWTWQSDHCNFFYDLIS